MNFQGMSMCQGIGKKFGWQFKDPTSCHMDLTV